MPPKSSKSPTASKPPIELNLAAVEDDISGLTLNDGEVHDIDEKSAPIGPGAKARRRRNREKSRRLERSKDAEADDAASKTPKERDSISEAGNAEPNDVSDTDTIATEPLPQFRLDHPPRHVMPISLSCLQADTSCSSIQAPLVGVPILAHYELRELPDTGDNEDDHDEGLFATQKIYQGTRIISERPILTLPAPGDQLQELVPAYYNLPKVEQERIWNLRPAAPEASEQLQNLRFLTDRLAFDLQNIIFKSDGARTKVEEATLEEMAPKLENAMNVWRVAARWHANRCSMTDLPAEQREYLPKGTPITGLFIERAHIRHSCLPNCFASYDANLGRMNVHVTRDIAAGEELTLSAFADTTYYKNAADRKEELSAWGLTCNCEACDEKHPKFQTHEAARQRAHTRAILLADTLTRLDVDEQFSEVPLMFFAMSQFKLTVSGRP